MKDNVINEKNVKIPLYVTAYETISQWLKEGKYKAGDKLPGENILAEQLAVSRGTLRQAMLLLQEDGLIINHQGKGNIVLSNQDMSKSGLEKVGNPIVDFCSRPIDKVVTAIGFQPATQKHQQVLKLRPMPETAIPPSGQGMYTVRMCSMRTVREKKDSGKKWGFWSRKWRHCPSTAQRQEQAGERSAW